MSDCEINFFNLNSASETTSDSHALCLVFCLLMQTRKPHWCLVQQFSFLCALCLVVGKVAGSDSMRVLYGHSIYRHVSKGATVSGNPGGIL